MSAAVSVAPPARAGSGVLAQVGDAEITFESDDVALRPSAEAFAGAVWISALRARADVELAAPADPVWLGNLSRVAALAREWWGYKPRAITAAGEREAGERRPENVLCFTGGVDSFHTLLCCEQPPEALVFAHGFDVDLADHERRETTDRALRAVAAASGARAIVIRSDIRRHSVFRRPGWARTHGAALAALGHLLAEQYGTLIVSSTHARDDLRPWGSDWRLDPLWSASDLAVVHRGADVPREHKLRQIAANDLVRTHLRVCWEHRNERLNCGHCDKCLAAMVTLRACDRLEGFEAFEAGADLPGRLDQLAETRYLAMYPRLLADGIPEPVAGAVRRLLERSAPSR